MLKTLCAIHMLRLMRLLVGAIDDPDATDSALESF